MISHNENMEPIFKDKKLQTEFDENGFVKVKLLSEIQVDELNALFNSLKAEHAEVNALHHTTTDTQKPELILQVDAQIKSVLMPELEKLMQNFKPLAGCFHIKESGAGSATGIHQDPTFVDETKFYSANVWVALHDVNERNGNLYFVPGSNKVECLRVTPNSPNYYRDFQTDLPAMAEQVPLKKGEAVIFTNSTIHGATDNLSNDLRLAATLLVCSKSAEWLIYYKDENTPPDKIEKYLLDLNSFVKMAKNGRPDKVKFKENILYNFPNLTRQQFLLAIKKQSAEVSYLQRIKNIFKTAGVA